MFWKTLCLLAFVSVLSFEGIAGQSNPTTQLHQESPANETESPSPSATQKNPFTTQGTDSQSPEASPEASEAPAPTKSTEEDDHIDNLPHEIQKWLTMNLDPYLKPGNESVLDEGTHRYYNSTVYSSKAARNLWKNLTEKNSITHKILSDSHMTAATEKLKFLFPFYGHKLKEVTIATGGFLSTGNDRENNMLAVAQYIAPLMANFDTRLAYNSSILYHTEDDIFVVEWRSVHLKDSETNSSFTFQAQLHKSGDIVFVYKDVPVAILNISDKIHPVKVGLSDAFTMNRNIESNNRHFNHKVFIEYHRIDQDTKHIANWTAIYYTPCEVCLNQETCEDCTSRIAGFNCLWCPTLKLCSDGTDRNREMWLKNKCQLTSFSNESKCGLVNDTAVETEYNDGIPTTQSRSTGTVSGAANDGTDDGQTTTDDGMQSLSMGLGTDRADQVKERKESSLSSSAITTVLVIMCFVVLIVGWVLYAYFHPHSASGQLLIKYRPSRFRWRRGEPSYTAAAIHM